MSPTSGIAISQLRQLVYYHLDNDMLDNANFLAGRWHAFEPRNPDSSHLLSLTYYRSRRFKAAYDFSHKYGANGRHLGCAYVFAQSCLEMGRNMEGVAALEKSRTHWVGKNDWSKHSETSRRHVPDAPAVSALLAKLYRAHGDLRKAGDCYIEAHKANPFVWDAFEGLCKIGADLKMENMFKPSLEMVGSTGEGSGETKIYIDEDSRQPLGPNPNYGPHAVMNPVDDPFTSARVDPEDQEYVQRVKGNSILDSSLRPSTTEWDTPTAGSGGLDDDIMMSENAGDDVFGEPPAAPSRRARAGHQFETSDRLRPPVLRATSEAPDDPSNAPRKSTVGAQKRTISGTTSQTSTDSTQPRRSNRLFTQTTTTRSTRSAAETTASVAGRVDRTARTAKPATGTKGRTGAVVGRVVSGNRKILPPEEREKEKRAAARISERSTTLASVPAVATAVTGQKQAQSQSDMVAEAQAMRGLLDNFRQLAVAYNSRTKFQSLEAIQIFKSFPSAQRETPWVLAQLARAQYEASDYRAAEDTFGRLMKMQPSRIEDMEIYSTVLWHLKKENVLTYLCRVLRDTHFNAPQTWVAIGNAFSLSREHELAISAFKRATQLDDQFAYAWTLMGHEHMANEAFDDALANFRKAVAIDRRGYGGWYGLGKCYERMGKLEDAERHYRIAAMINPSNATLLVCIGVILERLRNKPAALTHYAKALELAPPAQSALARFKKARVLMHMGEYDDALGELQILHDQAPDEANVHFLLGKCYKGLGDRTAAVQAFTTALNLDVKAAPYIKEALEGVAEDDDGDGGGDDSDDD